MVICTVSLLFIINLGLDWKDLMGYDVQTAPVFVLKGNAVQTCREYHARATRLTFILFFGFCARVVRAIDAPALSNTGTCYVCTVQAHCTVRIQGLCNSF